MSARLLILALLLALSGTLHAAAAPPGLEADLPPGLGLDGVPRLFAEGAARADSPDQSESDPSAARESQPILPGAPEPESGPPAAPAPDGPVLAEEEGIPERIVWDGTPIRLSLPVGRERRVRFPAPVRVGVPAGVEGKLRTQSLEGSVYWRAAAPFAALRVQVQEVESGRTYLLDLDARAGGSSAPVAVLRPAGAASADPAAPGGEGAASAAPATPDYVTLTRFAAQQMYAPSRLRPHLPGAQRVALHTADSLALVRGAAVQAVALIAWQAGELYVTVVRLRNATSAAVVLDPRDLRGQWLAATFQHARLLPAGDEADTTCVYLISRRPFVAALAGILG